MSKVNVKIGTLVLELSAEAAWALNNVIGETYTRFHPNLEKDQKAMLGDLNRQLDKHFGEKTPPSPVDEKCMHYIPHSTYLKVKGEGL